MKKQRKLLNESFTLKWLLNEIYIWNACLRAGISIFTLVNLKLIDITQTKPSAVMGMSITLGVTLS